MTSQIILLDLDDPLYPYAPCNHVGLPAAHGVLQRVCPDLDLARFLTMHDEARSHWAQALAGSAASHHRVLFFKRIVECCVAEGRLGAFDPALVLDVDEAYWCAFLAHMQGHPDMESVLESLGRSSRLALVTNQVAEVQLRKIRELGIARFFDAIVTSEEAGAEKPDARIYLEALDRLDGRAEHAWMIGDSAADISGAGACGIRTIHTSEYVKSSRPIEADYTVEHLGEVLAICTSDA